VTGAYARIRKQFGLSVGRFEGVEEALARIGGKAYAISALSEAAAAAVTRGELPAVPSTIAKYHCTEMAREVATDVDGHPRRQGHHPGPEELRRPQLAGAADHDHGGRREHHDALADDFWTGCDPLPPVGTQGNEGGRAAGSDERLSEFDRNLFGHVGFAFSNAVRSWWYGFTGARVGKAPGDAYTRRYYRKLNRYSAALALAADTSMLLLGGKLKFKESLSGRLGDVLSQLYIASAMLKRYEDQGRPVSDQPLLAWAFHDCCEQDRDRVLVRTAQFSGPSGQLPAVGADLPVGPPCPGTERPSRHKIASLLMSPNEARDRLAAGTFLTPCANNPAGRINSYLPKVILAEPVERKFLKALKNSDIEALDFASQLDEGVREGWITADERKQLEELREMTIDAISVDDFDTEELRSAGYRRGHYDSRAAA
jgi:acyl-CoA dehydrogenase